MESGPSPEPQGPDPSNGDDDVLVQSPTNTGGYISSLTSFLLSSMTLVFQDKKMCLRASSCLLEFVAYNRDTIGTQGSV